MTTLNMSYKILLVLVLSLMLEQVFLQSCDDFVISKNDVEYMRLNNAGVFACNQSNLCNAFQSLSLSNNGEILSLSDGNSVQLADPSSTNELQSLSIVGSTLSISDGNSVTLPAPKDNQTLSLSADKTIVSISGGNSITLPDSSASNEIQQLNLSGTQLSITQGNSVDLNTKKYYVFSVSAISVNKLKGRLQATFNSVDQNNFPDGSLSSRNSTFIAPFAGWYRFSCGGGFYYDSSGVAGPVYIAFYSAPSDPFADNQGGGYVGTVGVLQMLATTSFIRKLAVGQQMEVYFDTSGPVILGLNPSSKFWWQGEFLGAY